MGRITYRLERLETSSYIDDVVHQVMEVVPAERLDRER